MNSSKYACVQVQSLTMIPFYFAASTRESQENSYTQEHTHTRELLSSASIIPYHYAHSLSKFTRTTLKTLYFLLIYLVLSFPLPIWHIYLILNTILFLKVRPYHKIQNFHNKKKKILHFSHLDPRVCTISFYDISFTSPYEKNSQNKIK